MSEGQIDRAKRAAFYDGLFRPFSLLTSNGADNDDDRSLLDMKSDVDALWSSGEVVEPEDLIERAELGAKLARAISELNLKEWQLSLLRRIFVDGLDIAEAGREFGKSRALSHYHYKKMLRQLRALLISPT
jgi:DNA-directed RNA polymerase specialized sigma24 family protein